MDAPPSGYPAPIVAHEAAIKHARAEISKRWKSEGFRQESRAVNQKLGSRNRPPARKAKTKKIEIQQLSFDV
jgi:deoxyribodipyrimidine photo-lyase